MLHLSYNIQKPLISNITILLIEYEFNKHLTTI